MDKIQEAFDRIFSGYSFDVRKRIDPKAVFEHGYIAGNKAADLLPTEKVCPECGGRGHIGYSIDHPAGTEKCSKCKDGIIQLYYTPEQYKKIMDKDWFEDWAVYFKWIESKTWSVSTIQNLRVGVDIPHPELFIIIANEAGKPEANYRPKE